MGSRANQDGRKHRVTHCYLISSTDRARLVELGIVADFQLAPSSVTLDYRNFMFGLIGDRSNSLIPAVPVFETGARVTLSSDWDADILSPLVKLQTALTRPYGESFSSVQQVIPLMTKNAAELLNTNGGVIESGKDADLVVLDKDILELGKTEIQSAKVLLTVFRGEVVFDPNGIAGQPIGTFPERSSANEWRFVAPSAVITCAFLVF